MPPVIARPVADDGDSADSEQQALAAVLWAFVSPVNAAVGGGDGVGGHSLQSPVHSTDFSIVGNPNRSNCPADCVASAFLALAQN